MLCHVFPINQREKIFKPRTFKSFTSCNQRSLCTKVFIGATQVLPPLLQFWGCAPEEDVLVQDQFDGGEDIEGVVHLHGLSYVSKIIRTEWTTEKTREFVARKYYGDLQLLPIPTHCWKGTNYDLILVIIGWLTKMIQYKLVQITIDVPRLRRLDCQRLRLSLTSKFWSPRYRFRNLMTACRKNLSTGLIRQIPLRQTFGVTCMDLAITISNERFGSTALTLRPIKVGMINLSTPDLVRFRA